MSKVVYYACAVPVGSARAFNLHKSLVPSTDHDNVGKCITEGEVSVEGCSDLQCCLS